MDPRTAREQRRESEVGRCVRLAAWMVNLPDVEDISPRDAVVMATVAVLLATGRREEAAHVAATFRMDRPLRRRRRNAPLPEWIVSRPWPVNEARRAILPFLHRWPLNTAEPTTSRRRAIVSLFAASLATATAIRVGTCPGCRLPQAPMWLHQGSWQCVPCHLGCLYNRQPRRLLLDETRQVRRRLT
jgi:hypothetical protein